MLRRMLVALAALGAAAMPAAAQDRVTLVLNWVPGADHAPLYWANAQGRYREAGINLTIETGRGSAYSAQRIGSGGAQVGIVDMPNALQARGQGADLVAVMGVYVQSPYTIYWRRASGIRGPQDFKGRRFGAPPADAGRSMWPMISRVIGLQPNDVTWVNIAPEAKVASLQSGAIDATMHFYNVHYIYERTFGEELGFLRTRDIGFNPYSNAIFAHGPWLRANAEAARRLVRATQRAYADCLREPEPCLQAVSGPASQGVDDLRESWRLVAQLMADDPAAGRPLGGFEAARVQQTLEAVRTAFNARAEFAATDAFTNDLLDPSIPAPR